MDKGDPGFLTLIQKRKSQPFRNNHFMYYTFFLPADKVNPASSKEKKYRPFKFSSEFETVLKIGRLDIVVMRDKVRKNYVQYAPYLGFVETSEGLLQAFIIGCDKFGPTDLLKNYEWQDKQGVWHLFGVEVSK